MGNIFKIKPKWIGKYPSERKDKSKPRSISLSIERQIILVLTGLYNLEFDYTDIDE